jgi:hypothetical protein
MVARGSRRAPIAQYSRVKGLFMSQVKLPRPPAIWIDGVESNAKNPDTFLIPNLHERTDVKIGDFVKIGVESMERGHEKFWVEVIARIDNGNYVGRVDNDLADVWGINYNDQALFEPRHVLASQRSR